MAKNKLRKTEAGIIPDDWEIRKIGEIYNIINGRGFKPHEWARTGLPIIRIQNLNGSEDFNYYSGDFNPKILVKNGQLLFSWSGSKGTSFGPYIWKGVNALLNYHTWKLSSKSPKVDDNYFFHILKMLTKKIENSAHGASALVHTQKGEMEQFYIPIPEKSEQRNIANALSDMDDQTSKMRTLIAKKHAIKTATMQQLLTGKIRLLGFKKKQGYKRWESYEIPKDWEFQPLGAIFNFSGGFSATREQLSYDGHCYLHYGDIHKSNKSFIDLQTEYTDIPKLNISLGRISSGSLLDDGDVVFVDASEDDEGTSKYMVVVNRDNEPFIAGLHTIVAKSKTRSLDNIYKRYCFQIDNIKKQFRFYSVGTKVSGISKTNIKKIMIGIPPIPEQKAIATIISDMDAEIDKLITRLDKIREIKQGMMQELLTGRTRLV